MSMPSPVVEALFDGTNWTDISSYLRAGSTRRGANVNDDTIQPGTSVLTLDNRDRRFEPGYVASPYYPYIIDGCKLRVRIPGGAVALPTLTVSGNEITDATRAAALAWGTGQQGGQTDGLQNDGSFFIGRAATNLFRRGQCDAATDWGFGGSDAVTRTIDATTPAPFSPQSMKYVCAGTGPNPSAMPQSAAGQAIAAGTSCVGSMYFKGVAGQTYWCRLRIINTDASTTFSANAVYVATGDWDLMVAPAVAVAAGKTGDQVRVEVLYVGTLAQTFWAAHPMIEKGQSVVAPYVPTSGGVTATKPAARVQAPANLLDRTQGGIALRLTMGWPSTAGLTAPTFLSLSDGTTNNRIQLRFSAAKWVLDIISAGAGGNNALVAQAFAAGDAVTVIARWTAAGTCDISINGAPFGHADGGAGTFVPPVALTQYDIGNADGSGLTGRQIDSRVKWAATFTGTLTDQDAATIAAWTDDPPMPYFFNYPASWRITGVWTADTATYETPDYASIIEGSVDKWPVTWPGGGFDGIVQVNITDDMGKLNSALVTAGPWPVELTGARVNRYFDIIFGVGSTRNVGAGWSQVQAYSPNAENALSNLRVVEASEDGVLFIAADGTPTFLDRQTQLKAPYNAAAATFADENNLTGTQLPYKQLVPLLDNTFVRNAITVTAPGQVAASAVDAASETQRGTRSKSISTLLTTGTDMGELAAYELSQTKDAALRFQSMLLEPSAHDELWPVVLGLDLRRRIAALRTPEGGGAAMSLDCLIQGVQHTWDTKSWQTTWPLANALSGGAWIMDTSALDSGTRLTF